jgi:hypothetical protein
MDTIIIAYRIDSILRNISEKLLKYFHCKNNIKSYILKIFIKNAIVHKTPGNAAGSQNARPIPVMRSCACAVGGDALPVAACGCSQLACCTAAAGPGRRQQTAPGRAKPAVATAT